MDELIFGAPKSMAKEKMAELPEWQPEQMGNSFLASMGMRGPSGRAS